MRITFQILLACVMSLSTVTAHSDGTVSSACNDRDMKPGHNTGFDESGSVFSITIENGATEYTPGGKEGIPIKISGTRKFKGFLIQAKSAKNPYDIYTKGKMSGAQSITQPICGRANYNGMTHTTAFSSTLNSGISLLWTPPSLCDSIKAGDIHFQATVVEAVSKPAHIKIFSKKLTMAPVDQAVRDACFPPDSKASNKAFSLVLTSVMLLMSYMMC